MPLWLVVLTAWAGPRRDTDAVIDEGRPLAAALERAGWVATPEGSDRYRPGSVYDARNGLWTSDCFTATPSESIYNELEVSLALQAGARVPLGLVTAEADGLQYKRLTYADPRVSELEGRQLSPTPACLRDLQAAGDVSGWYVVQAVLLAEVNEQRCTEASASVRAPVGGGGASVKEECSVASTGQVAVAFKTVPVSRWVSPQPTPVVVPAPQPVARPAPAPAPNLATATVPAGKYTIGCTAGQQGQCQDDEAKRTVTLSHAVAMGVTEVTQGQWSAVMGNNPALGQQYWDGKSHGPCSNVGVGDGLPVTCVSWVDSARFANALSRRDGLEQCYAISGEDVRWSRGVACTGWRLPTESEWEVAARGGRDTLYPGGGEVCALGNVVNTTRTEEYRALGMNPDGWAFAGCDDGYAGLAPVGSFVPNGYGLYDMSGNVSEWTWDWYYSIPAGGTDVVGPQSGSERVIRGGGWNAAPGGVRAAYRSSGVPDGRYAARGLRLARTVP